jgi:AcrR family transcriptional regulator
MATARPTGAARREALLDAALACFEERGLVHTGIEDIRKAAGASPSSVYHLFRGLPELIAALLERTFVRRYAAVTVAVLRTRTAKRAAFAMVDAHLAWVFAHPVEARFMYRALALDLDGGHRESLRAKKEQLKAELLAHLAQLGVVDAAAGGEVTIDVVLLGTTHQACRTWLSSPHAIDQRWMKKVLPTLAWRTARSVLRP